MKKCRKWSRSIMNTSRHRISFCVFVPIYACMNLQAWWQEIIGFIRQTCHKGWWVTVISRGRAVFPVIDGWSSHCSLLRSKTVNEQHFGFRETPRMRWSIANRDSRHSFCSCSEVLYSTKSFSFFVIISVWMFCHLSLLSS